MELRTDYQILPHSFILYVSITCNTALYNFQCFICSKIDFYKIYEFW